MKQLLSPSADPLMTLLEGLVRPFSWPSSTFARALCVAVTAWLVATSTPVAYAHPEIDRAVAFAADAEFDAALEAFDVALGSGSLSREQLVELLAARILVLHALGKKQQLDDDLGALVMLDGAAALDEHAPPQLLASLAKKKRDHEEPLAFEASCEPSKSRTKVHTRVRGLSANVPVTLRIHVRGSHESAWSSHEVAEFELTEAMGSEVSYFAELVAYGGVVLASAGSQTSPRTCSQPDEPRLVQVNAAVAVDATPPPRDNPRRKKWWWIGAGSVLAIGAVTVAVLATRDSEPARSSVANPMVRFE